MELLPKELADKIPALYATENLGDDAIVHAKFFTPWTFWTWYVLEYDGSDKCFGLVSGYEVELGYWLVSELEAITHDSGLTIERDLFFEPTTLGKIREELNW